MSSETVTVRLSPEGVSRSAFVRELLGRYGGSRGWMVSGDDRRVGSCKEDPRKTERELGIAACPLPGRSSKLSAVEQRLVQPASLPFRPRLALFLKVVDATIHKSRPS
jgi:hypothetical protein